MTLAVDVDEFDGVEDDAGVVDAEAAEFFGGELPEFVAGEVFEVGFPLGDEFVVEQGADEIVAYLDGERVAVVVADDDGGSWWGCFWRWCRRRVRSGRCL